MQSLSLQHILNSITESTPMVLGVSGGIDSMSLLHLCHVHGLRNIIVAHVNHNIRKDSQEDEALVASTAKEYGYTMESSQVHLMGGNIEHMAREKRYEFFRHLLIKYRASWIMTAHHQDDNVESQLLHILRGSGLFGIIGMKIIDQKQHLIRPLLKYTKADIHAYAKQHNVPYREDSTNQDTGFSRNALRLDIIPTIKRQFPDMGKHLSTLSDEANHVLHEYYDNISVVLGAGFENETSWAFDTFTSLAPPLRNYALIFIIRACKPMPGYNHGLIQEISNKLPRLSSGHSLDLNKDWVLLREFDTLRLVNRQDDENTAWDNIPHLSEMVNQKPSPFPIYLEDSKDNYQIVQRTQAMKFRIHNNTEPFHKPLKKLLGERKIPVSQREKLYFLQHIPSKDLVAILSSTYHYAPTPPEYKEIMYFHSL